MNTNIRPMKRLLIATIHYRQNLMHINIWYERMIIQKLEYEPEYTLNSIVGKLSPFLLKFYHLFMFVIFRCKSCYTCIDMYDLLVWWSAIKDKQLGEIRFNDKWCIS